MQHSALIMDSNESDFKAFKISLLYSGSNYHCMALPKRQNLKNWPFTRFVLKLG